MIITLRRNWKNGLWLQLSGWHKGFARMLIIRAFKDSG